MCEDVYSYTYEELSSFVTLRPVLVFLNNLWGLGTTKPGGIGSLDSILGLLIRLKIRARIANRATHHLVTTQTVQSLLLRTKNFENLQLPLRDN
jgi:hypothetical protein